MVDAAVLRRVAMALPQARDNSEAGFFRFEVAGKGFAWTCVMRVKPKTPRVAQPGVLIRLAAVEADELAGLLRAAWRRVAPKPLGAAHPE